MERYLNFDEFFHWLGHRWRAALALLVLLLAGGYALSGFTQIAPDERGVVLRFGRPVEDLEPGLHYRWPWPVERVVRVQPDRVRTVEIGFRTSAGGAGAQESLAWSSPHAQGGGKRVADEAVMITGDGNLVEVQATVRFRITNPRVYLFEARDPDEVVRASAESVLRGLIAGRPFLDLLTTRRGQFQALVLERLKERCADYKLGVELQGFALHDLHPPQEVVPAYHEVARAMQERAQAIERARAEQLRLESAAKAEALQILAKAEAAKAKKIAEDQAGYTHFLAWSRSRKQLAFEHDWPLVLDAVGDLLKGSDPERVCVIYESRRFWALFEQVGRVALDKRHLEPLHGQAALTDFRLYRGALGQALAGRKLKLIDADNLPGWLQLILLDPEQFRVPFPVLVPSQGSPPRGAQGANGKSDH
jgi:HflK protein